MGEIKLGDGTAVDIGLGNFLKAENITDGIIGVLLNAGTTREADFGSGELKTVIEFEIELEGKEGKEQYLWTLNKKTLNNLADGTRDKDDEIIVEGYGEDCKQWVGKEVKLTLVKMNVFGRIKDVIIGEPVAEKEKTVEGKKVKSVKIQIMTRKKKSEEVKPAEQWGAKEWEQAYEQLIKKFNALRDHMRIAVQHLSKAI